MSYQISRIAAILLGGLAGWVLVDYAKQGDISWWVLVLVLAWVIAAGHFMTMDRPEDIHRHIWGVWEDCQITGSEWLAGRKVQTLSPGQCRDCMSCGQREARKVVTS